MQPPTFADVLDAQRQIAPHITRTPLRRHAALCDLLDAEVWVKHENMQILGAFKVRGGLNLVGRASDDERERGFVSASTGNHGQSIAHAARTFGSRATIVVPEGANPVKVEAMRSLGATVLFRGKFFEEAMAHAQQLAHESGTRYVHSANEPWLIAGVATYMLEIYEDLSGVDLVIVPLGAGSGAAGACIVTEAVSPSTRVIAVQSRQAPSGFLSWKEHGIREAPTTTFAEGMATASGYDLPQQVLREHLDDFVLVDDARIREAMYRYIECTRTLVEGAGAAPLAAAMDMKNHLAGKRVVLIASGGNVSPIQLKSILSEWG